jgi:glycosyltransferase involved in cell wall biosynthesis
MPTCVFVSFRLGLTDGVSVAAENWRRSLEHLGFVTRTVAGEGPVDRLVSGLEIGAPDPPDVGDVEAALADADLVVVENLCTIPMNLPAARVVTRVLRGRPAVLHHHDPPWQRARYADVTELPTTDPTWRHVTINDITRRQFADRGIDATTIYNGFDTAGGSGDRDATRAALDVAPDETLFGHPVRAIARKGIADAVALCEAIGATYWLLGDPEDGYADQLDTILAAARCRVVRGALPHGPDIYAAPDLIVFPSTWEGFGNPPIEAALHRRMTAIGPYPVARELEALGFRWLDAADVDAVADWLRGAAAGDPTSVEILDHNRRLAETHFSLDALRRRLADLLTRAGWL